MSFGNSGSERVMIEHGSGHNTSADVFTIPVAPQRVPELTDDQVYEIVAEVAGQLSRGEIPNVNNLTAAQRETRLKSLGSIMTQGAGPVV